MTSKRQKKAARALATSPKASQPPKERRQPPTKRPLPLVIEGALIEQCQGIAEVRKKAKIPERFRLTVTKAGTYLLHAPSEKDREEALSRPDQKEFVIRPTRKQQEQGTTQPCVVITNFPPMIDVKNINSVEGETYTRLRSAKTGHDIRKVKVSCTSTAQKERFMSEGFQLENELYKCEEYKPT